MKLLFTHFSLFFYHFIPLRPIYLRQHLGLFSSLAVTHHKAQLPLRDMQCAYCYTLHGGELSVSRSGLFTLRHRTPLTSRLSGPHSRSENFGERKSMVPFPRIKHDSYVVQPVA